MQVDEALGQIAEIHDQLARGEHYRGFRPISVALSGLIGLLAALAWPLVVNFSWYDGAGPTAFAIFWLVVAAIAGGVGDEPAVYSYLFHENEFTRRRTRRIGGQFLPCVVAGLFVTIAAIRAGENVVHLLSGVWMLLFSLGVFAARPFLPRSIGWVGLFYLIAGADTGTADQSSRHGRLGHWRHVRRRPSRHGIRPSPQPGARRRCLIARRHSPPAATPTTASTASCTKKPGSES